MRALHLTGRGGSIQTGYPPVVIQRTGTLWGDGNEKNRGAFDNADFQFRLSQIQWISVVLARYEAIQGAPSLDCFTLLSGSQ
ncbi:MAG: hypothetical protein LBS88_00660 [Tannerellaceae bacterium]|nr:hypothetical protein [Tannerellaceae bacterium]